MKKFKDMETVSERFAYIAEVVQKNYADEEVQAVVSYLQDYSERQVKLRPSQQEKITIAEQLQEAIYSVMKDGERRRINDIFEILVQMNYEDGHQSGLTIGRVTSGITALRNLGFITRFDAELEDKSSKFYGKKSYRILKQ